MKIFLVPPFFIEEREKEGTKMMKNVPTNSSYSIQFLSNPNTLKVDDFVLNQFWIYVACIKYARTKKKIYSKYKAQIEKSIAQLEINSLTTKKVNGYHSVSTSGVYNVYRKPIKGLPNFLPQWMIDLKLSGLWCLLCCPFQWKYFSENNVKDILKGLAKIRPFFDQPQASAIKEIEMFLKKNNDIHVNFV